MQVLFSLFLTDKRNTITKADCCSAIGKTPRRTSIYPFGIVFTCIDSTIFENTGTYGFLLWLYIHIHTCVIVQLLTTTDEIFVCMDRTVTGVYNKISRFVRLECDPVDS